jgi:hypothetical protein
MSGTVIMSCVLFSARRSIGLLFCIKRRVLQLCTKIYCKTGENGVIFLVKSGMLCLGNISDNDGYVHNIYALQVGLLSI